VERHGSGRGRRAALCRRIPRSATSALGDDSRADMPEPEQRRQCSNADDSQVAGPARLISDDSKPIQNKRRFARACENRPDEG
jgi:hypothetical protein